MTELIFDLLGMPDWVRLGRITQEYLKSILHYDPDSGIFTYLNNGKQAGSLNPNGYRYISIKGKSYREHGLAWMYMTGEWCKKDIDHIGKPDMTKEEAHLNKSDNRWCNLREASESQNGVNRGLQKNNTTGFKGITKLKSGRYHASIQIDGKKHSLGTYDSPEEAGMVALKARQEHFREFA